MQCRLPRKNIPSKKLSLKWFFNESLSWTDSVRYDVTFRCNLQYYDAIMLTWAHSPSTMLYIRYLNHGSSNSWVNAGTLSKGRNPPFLWKQETYRTITFDTPPTGDLLTWLTANATPQ